MKEHKRRKDMKSITFFMFIIIILIWIILIFIKYFVWGITFGELFDDIVSNILGILPPIIIFNFAYEYFTKQHVAEEMSEQITGTLMSDIDAINVFNCENKTKFIKTTISTIVGEDTSDMVYALIEPYLSKKYNIRKSFKYTITIRDYRENKMFSPEKYMKIYENLKYKKLYTDKNLPKEFNVGFFTNAYEVDKKLRNQMYIFRENFTIEQQIMDKLLLLSEEEKFEFIAQELQLNVYVDDKKCVPKRVLFDSFGIDIFFESNHSLEEREHSVEISFNIPQIKGHSDFLVSLSEPTYSPMIQLSYPEDTKSVKAFSFLNDGDESLLERAIHYAGGYEFCAQDKWIYPMSGVVFTIDENDNVQ